jgi:hypothetical protein
MKPSIQTLGQILYSPSQYVIPVFQRNYRWEIQQWAKLWDSLIEIQNPDKHGNHFMGFLVFVPGLAQPGQHTTFHLIDGQQRLTTSSILLTAIRNIARKGGQEELADEIHQYYLVHPLKRGEQHYRLMPKERDHDSYLGIVSGQTESTGRIADALAYFEEQLSYHAADGLDTGVDDKTPGRRELRVRFWRGLNDYLVAEYPDCPNIDVRPSWIRRLPSGLRHIGFEIHFNLRRQYVGIDVWFWRQASFPVWKKFASHHGNTPRWSAWTGNSSN